MFDFHLHSSVSFDSTTPSVEILRAAERKGLCEICFTDHYDCHDAPTDAHDLFTAEEYAKAYDGLSSNSVLIRRGVEFGMTKWNRAELDALLLQHNFDFVIGSVHYAGGFDPYDPDYWQGKTVQVAFSEYLVRSLECVGVHDNYDVLGHLNYVCKSPNNPAREPLRYEDYSDICDEIMKVLVQKGKGMEINTSGVDCVGDFLPSAPFLRRFKELGGEIVTVGSDAHDPARVGQYATEALAILKDIFGYVCTFEGRRPIFHKL